MLKILIVDDEELTREVLVNYLPWDRIGDVMIQEADNGLVGYSICANFNPDIVISDIKMPLMNGIEMAEKIKLEYPLCKFIFLSAYSDKEYLKAAINLKILRYVEKPIELEEVQAAVEQAIEEIKTETAMRENINLLLPKEVCLSLIHSNANVIELKEKINSLGLPFSTFGNYLSIVASIVPSYDTISLETKDYRDDFLCFTKPFFERYKDSLLISPKDKEYMVIHFNFKAENEYLEFVSSLFEMRARFSEKSQYYRFSIGIGIQVENLSDIYQSYETAVIAMKRCFYHNINCINYYAEDSKPPIVMDKNFISEIVKLVKAQEITKAIIETKKILKQIKQFDNTHPEAVKSIMMEIVLGIIKVADDRNNTELQNLCKLSIKKIEKSYNLSEIGEVLITLFQAFYIKAHNDSEVDIIYKINKYIQEQYTNEELSLNLLALKFKLTINYLCYIYKKETGKTINQYITEVRIQHAKQLLLETNMKLYHIAERVGYQDGKYFSKVFLKSVGMKPALYRERHLYD